MISPTSASDALESSRPATDPTSRAVISGQEAVHDTELVRRFNAGDDVAFVEIVTRYRERMLSIALSLVRNHADAEDIAQNTFIRAHRGLAHFRGDSSLATWLHRIAFNLSRNHYWYFFRRHRHATLSLDCAFNSDNEATFLDLIASDEPSPAREETNREFLACVTTCMEKLSLNQREILTLRNGLNLPYGEIAKALGIGIGTVKSRIARARENLRAFLAEAYPECGPDASPSDWFDPARPASRLAAACS
ncbi:MAG TPA: sigma-70 family RNA polymerase sigma factor [Opitutaceae bacterium]|jgi:RNA polymerase sigma-70 factor (ECF subfamily)|nr:sigma-70 family RNA polymerase sigma factor [Opitutaceae bacterium]